MTVNQAFKDLILPALLGGIKELLIDKDTLDTMTLWDTQDD